jgi:hypothetical protein
LLPAPRVGQDVAARAEHAPRDPGVVERADDRGGLRLGLGDEEPVDPAADAQARQLGEAAAALGAHARPARDLPDPRVARLYASLSRLFAHHF